MKKIILLFIILSFCFISCDNNNKEYIFIYAKFEYISMFSNVAKSDVSWHKAEVLEKRDNMYKIRIDKAEIWFDTTDEEILWKPF
jgi:hypothetical protein